MKNIIVLILLAQFLSCDKTNITIGKTSEPVIVSGIIKNYSPGSDLAQISADLREYGSGNQLSYVSGIANDGSFTIKFTRYLPQTVWINYNKRFNLFIYPGDSLFIEIDADKKDYIEFLKGLKFHGNTSKSNLDLCEYSINLYQNHPEYKSPVNDALSPLNYKAKCDSIRSVLLEDRKMFLKRKKPTKEVEIWTLYSIEISYLNSLLVSCQLDIV